MEKEKWSILFPPFPQVDSFVYENCSHNVDTFSEFCTGNDAKIMKIEADEHQLSGAKLLTTYEMHYQTDGDSFMFIKGRWVAFLLFIGQLGHLMRSPN